MSEGFERVLARVTRAPSSAPTLSGAAREAACSPRWFNEQMRRRTGKTYHACITDLRLREARRLLSETGLAVGRVAAKAGFSRPDHFSALFHRNLGVSPRRYRQLHPAQASRVRAGKARLVFRDDLERDAPGPAWDPVAGRWEVRGGILRGESQSDLTLVLDHPLPPDFLFTCELRIDLREQDPARGDLILQLAPAAPSDPAGYIMALDLTPRCDSSAFRRGRLLSSWQERFPCGGWHALEIRFVRDALRLAIDGRTVFETQDPRPLGGRERSRLRIGSWNCALSVRMPALHAFPLPASEDPIDRGDRHVAEGHLDRALALYDEARAAGTERETELLYKIGMIYLDRGFPIRARSYLDPFVHERPSTPWATLARLRLLEAELGEMTGETATKATRTLLESESSAAPRLQIMDFAVDRIAVPLVRRGDFEAAHDVATIVRTLAPEHSFLVERASRLCRDALLCTYRWKDTVDLCRDDLKRVGAFGRARLHLSLFEAKVALGRFDEAGQALELATEGAERFLLAEIAIARAHLLRATGDLAGAAALLASVTERFADVAQHSATAAVALSRLLAAAGHLDGARRAGRAESPDMGHSALRQRRYLEYSLLVIAGEYRRAVELLGGSIRTPSVSDPDSLLDQVLLQVLYELAGEESRSRRNLDVLLRSLTVTPMWRWLLPVSYLLGKTAPKELWAKAHGMGLFGGRSSSSLFYMLGLVMQRRGRKRDSRDLFRMAAKSDPVNEWPALLARRELGKLTPPMKAFLTG